MPWCCLGVSLLCRSAIYSVESSTSGVDVRDTQAEGGKVNEGADCMAASDQLEGQIEHEQSELPQPMDSDFWKSCSRRRADDNSGCPSITSGATIVDRKSVFQAHVADAYSKEDVSESGVAN